MTRSVAATLFVAALAGVSAGQSSFVNWESAHVHPVDITPDGSTLLVVNTAENRLMTFDITGDAPVYLASVPVGLDPVSVRARSNTQAWVVNQVSDSVSIVDLTSLNVIATIGVGDEPADVIFAGSPARAFVSISQLNQVKVYNPDNLSAALTTIAITGEEPRALVTDGTNVYAAIFESGNKSSIVRAVTVSSAANPYPGRPNPPPNSGTNFDPPLAPGLPTPPTEAMIVKKDAANVWRDDNGGNWSLGNVSNPADNDVAIINASTLAVSYAKGLMNINMAIGLRPAVGGSEITTVGTDATNEVRFEPNVKATFVRVKLGRFNTTTPASTSSFDLNPHLTYAVRSVEPAIRQQAIGDPRGVVWSPDGSTGYITGMGSNNVISIDGAGARTGRVDVGQGPTGIVLDAARSRLYILNRFAGSISTVGLSPFTELSRISFFDPTPQTIKDGRPFLFDTHLTSGLGQASCASCHVDARWDALAWDLGDPSGSVKPFDQSCNFGLGGCENWHPMKGPLLTQTLVGIGGTEPFHWRGDRADIGEFSHAFISVLGGDADLPGAEMGLFQAYINTIVHSPQPNRLFDNGLPAAMPNGGNPINGQQIFNNSAIFNGTTTCISCLSTASGSIPQIIPGNQMGGTQSMKVTGLRDLYRRTGFSLAGQATTRGFGFIHDGSFDSIFGFLQSPVFQFLAGAPGNQQRRDLEALLQCWDSGVHAAIGIQTTLVSEGSATQTQLNLIDAMVALADTGSVGLVVKGLKDGGQRGWMYVGGQTFQSDLASETIGAAALRSNAALGSELTYTIVPSGMATRLGVDRDLDGHSDRDELLAGSNPDDPNSVPPPPPLPCPADLNGDLIINTADLTTLLGTFGESVIPGTGADINGDGLINTPDLTALLGVFGTNCP